MKHHHIFIENSAEGKYLFRARKIKEKLTFTN